SDDAAANVPRRCRGYTAHQKQLFGLPLPKSARAPYLRTFLSRASLPNTDIPHLGLTCLSRKWVCLRTALNRHLHEMLCFQRVEHTVATAGDAERRGGISSGGG